MTARDAAPFPLDASDRRTVALRAGTKATAEVWRRARAAHPEGTALVRVIVPAERRQHFEPVPETQHNFMDGATVVRPSTTDTPEAWAALIAEYDALFLGEAQ